MKLDIKSKNITLTDAIRAFVEQKLASLEAKASRFGASVSYEAEVGMTTKHHKKGPIFRAEVHVRLPGNMIYAQAEDFNLYVALGEAKKEAERQIIAYKGLKDAKMKRGARLSKSRRA